MLTILGKAASINVRKVFWLCDEIGVPYAHEEQPARESLLALNPHGLVPVLRDGDLVLWESHAILRYLAARHARHDLLPADPAARARVEMWMDWQAAEFNPAWSYAFQGIVRGNPACQDAALLAQSVAGWTRQVAVLEQRLQYSRHVAAQDFTLADIPIGLAVNRWFMTPLPQRPVFEHIAAYYDRLGERRPYRDHGRNGLA